MSNFTLISSKPFDQVVAAVNAAVGHPNMAEFGRSTHDARSFAELKSAVEKGLSKAGLMLFMQLDQGTVVQKETGQDTPRIIRLFIGNPLIPVPAHAIHFRKPLRSIPFVAVVVQNFIFGFL